MKKNLIIFITMIGLAGLLSSCERDDTKVIMLDSPTVPTIKSMPSLSLQRAQGNDTLTFTGTPVDPGFHASAIYFLEACVNGNGFADAVTVWSGTQDTLIKISVMDVNTALLKKFTADQTSSADFRIRSVLVVDAGTGALGTSTNPLTYSSPITTVSIKPYGLPRLDLMDSGIAQKIESVLGDGNYVGYVKLDATKSFTLKNPDANITYGGSAGVLAVNGASITPDANGWYKLTANTNTLTYILAPYNIGLIGSSTPNGWSAPDSKMNYNPQSGLWELTLNLVVGAVKFRMNDSWNDGINLGIGDADHPENTIDNLWNNGSSKDIPIATAGNYTVKLKIGTSTYSCSFTKNP